MIAIPELNAILEIPSDYNTAGFNPFVATKLLDEIQKRRSQAKENSSWLKVPALIQRPVMDHVEVVLSNQSPETERLFRKAEFGDFGTDPEPFVRQSLTIIREKLGDYYKLFGGVNETV